MKATKFMLEGRVSMNLLIVPKPLFSGKMMVEGYYMASQYGNAILESTKSNPLDRAMDSPLIDFMNEVGLDALTQGNKIFIPITHIQLVTDLTRNIQEDPGKIVFLLDERVTPDALVLKRCEALTSAGYKLAVVYKGDAEYVRAFSPYINCIFLKVPLNRLADYSAAVSKEFPKAGIVATEIGDKAIFDQLIVRNTPIDLYDGTFYKVRVPSNAKQTALSPLKTNYLQLLNIVNQDDFDFQTFTRTVRQDTGLAIQFMRLVNNASKSRAEIKNLNQAAAMLGQKEIKKWVSTAVSNALCVDSPSEITRLSLVRAKFCENLAKHFEMAIHQENLFIMGLFSVLDVVLDMPIEEAFKLVFVPPQIYSALVDSQGEFYSVLFFVKNYERGHWKEVSRIALVRNISIESIHEAYKEAMLWYADLIETPVDENRI